MALSAAFPPNKLSRIIVQLSPATLSESARDASPRSHTRLH